MVLVKLKMTKIEIPPIFTISMKTNTKSTSPFYLPKLQQLKITFYIKFSFPPKDHCLYRVLSYTKEYNHYYHHRDYLKYLNPL